MEKKWQLLYPDYCDNFTQLTQAILTNRQLTTADLSTSIMPSALTPKEVGLQKTVIKKACQRLQQAKDNQETVVIFGDYDVDGNCATAIMWQGLKEFGLSAQPFIPHRLKHGYGMTIKAVREIIEQFQPQLIITVDNGISALPALEFCQQKKLDVIVTDHHQPLIKDGKIVTPPAMAVVTTSRLSGAGVSWFLIKELLGDQQIVNDLLDLVCLATVVDQVPLTGVNRQLTRAGLLKLRQSKRAGIRALAQEATLELTTIRAREIGFNLGPRINAIGRLTNTLEALRLLCTRSPAKAKQSALTLTTVNHERQDLTQEMLTLALAQVPKKLPKIIIVASEEFHEGIIGLIASKLVDLYARPALVISLTADSGKGSGRSVPGFNLTNFLHQLQDDLLEYGGHAGAAGFSLERKKLARFKKDVQTLAATALPEKLLVPTIVIDAVANPQALYHTNLAKFLDQLEPLGASNPPICLQVGGTIARAQTLGAANQHLKLTITDDRGATLPILIWNYADHHWPLLKSQQKLTVVGELKLDFWRGKPQPALIGLDFHLEN